MKSNRDLILAIIVMVLIGLLIMQHFMKQSDTAVPAQVIDTPGQK